jgi:hypothetical protein
MSEAELPPFDQWFNQTLGGRISTVSGNHDALWLELICSYPWSDTLLRCSMVCDGVAEAYVLPDVIEEFTVASSHPLLLSYSEPTYFLHFSSAPASAVAAIGALYLAHREVVGTWRPFERFFNHSMDLAVLLSGGHGLLAQGPLRLMQAYQSALADSMSTYLRSAAGADQPAPALKLLLFDEDYYVICKDYYVICKDYYVEIAPLIDPPAG